MALFYYNTQKRLEPRPGRRYSTVYLKQDYQERTRLFRWLTEVAEQIIDICQHDPQVADWFTRGMRDFPKSQQGHYYTPEDIIMDMLEQLNAGRDLPEAMLGRWNRMCEGTPWQIEFVKTQDMPFRAQ